MNLSDLDWLLAMKYRSFIVYGPVLELSKNMLHFLRILRNLIELD